MSATPIRRRRSLLALAVLAALTALVGLGPAQPAGAFTCGEVDQRTQFVCNTYNAVAGRAPSSADLDYWVPKMPAQRTFFVATVAKSTEGRRLVVERYYSRFFETGPNEADYQYWAPRVNQASALRQLEAALLSDGSLSTDDFLDHAFGAQMGREPTMSEVEYWGDRVESSSQTKVAGELSNVLETRRVRVRGAYLNDLGYAPDAAGWAYWAEKLRTGTSYFDFRIAVRSSPGAYPGNRDCYDAAAPQFTDLCVA